MVSLSWCYKQKQGIKLIEPNENLARAYSEMADDSFRVMNNEKDKSIRWAVSSCYYSMYHSLYSFLMKLGIKSEMHSCTLKFMELELSKFYSKQDAELIKKAFNLRISAQYYVNKLINKREFEFIFSNALSFIEKTKEILTKLNEDDINTIRNKVSKAI